MSHPTSIPVPIDSIPIPRRTLKHAARGFPAEQVINWINCLFNLALLIFSAVDKVLALGGCTCSQLISGDLFWSQNRCQLRSTGMLSWHPPPCQQLLYRASPGRRCTISGSNGIYQENSGLNLSLTLCFGPKSWLSLEFGCCEPFEMLKGDAERGVVAWVAGWAWGGSALSGGGGVIWIWFYAHWVWFKEWFWASWALGINLAKLVPGSLGWWRHASTSWWTLAWFLHPSRNAFLINKLKVSLLQEVFACHSFTHWHVQAVVPFFFFSSVGGFLSNVPQTLHM